MFQTKTLVPATNAITCGYVGHACKFVPKLFSLHVAECLNSDSSHAIPWAQFTLLPMKIIKAVTLIWTDAIF